MFYVQASSLESWQARKLENVGGCNSLYFMHTLALQDGPTENDTRECNTLCLSYILDIMLQKAFELGFILGGWGTPRWNRQGCSSEILNLTPKGDHLGVAQAFCDP